MKHLLSLSISIYRSISLFLPICLNLFPSYTLSSILSIYIFFQIFLYVCIAWGSTLSLFISLSNTFRKDSLLHKVKKRFLLDYVHSTKIKKKTRKYNHVSRKQFKFYQLNFFLMKSYLFIIILKMTCFIYFFFYEHVMCLYRIEMFCGGSRATVTRRKGHIQY